MSASVCRFNEDLIDLVQSNPALYDCNLQAYKNDELKLATWKKISERLDEDVEICRRRWRSLRTRYRRELSKIERGVNHGKSKSEKRTWVYFDKMGFLYEYLRTKENVTYAIEGLSSDEVDENPSMVPSKKLKMNGSDLPENFTLEDLNTGIGNEDLQEQLVNGNACPSARKTPKLSPVDFIGYSRNWAMNNPKSGKDSFDKLKYDLKEPDEFELFGRLIAVKMRKLKNPTATQITILNAINEQEKEEKREEE